MEELEIFYRLLVGTENVFFKDQSCFHLCRHHFLERYIEDSNSFYPALTLSSQNWLQYNVHKKVISQKIDSVNLDVVFSVGETFTHHSSK